MNEKMVLLGEILMCFFASVGISCVLLCLFNFVVNICDKIRERKGKRGETGKSEDKIDDTEKRS
ncbi:MAG: hypothetical protein VB118_06735 [Oscillospiraceae bacterium]|nr:hypothetical protein [Oscillospiraceae bacterium]